MTCGICYFPPKHYFKDGVQPIQGCGLSMGISCFIQIFLKKIQGLFKDFLRASDTLQGLFPPSPESLCFLLSDKVVEESKKSVRPLQASLHFV